MRVIPTLLPTFETGLGSDVERQEHPHPLQIPAQPDPTPGVPPLFQIWDPRFLSTYDFGRWTSGPFAPDKWIDIAAAIAQSMAHMKLGVLIAFGHRAYFSSPGFDEWARAMAALTPDAERVVDVISGELAGCRPGDVVPEDKGAASATGASTDRAGQWRDKCALPNLSCFAFLVW